MNRTLGAVTLGLLLALALGCSTPPKPRPIDADLVTYAAAGKAAYDQGQWAQAVRSYTHAANRARMADDYEQLAIAAGNLASCYLAENNAPAAAVELADSLADARVAGAARANLLLLAAMCERAQGRLDQAEELRQQAAESSPDPTTTVQLDVLQANLLCDRADPALVATPLPVEQGTSLDLDEAVRAEVLLAQARLALLRADATNAAPRFLAAADLLRECARYREMALALGNAGRAFQETGLASDAAACYFRAGRSLYAQGEWLESLKMVEAGVQAAENLAESPYAAQLAVLFGDIKDAMKQESEKTDKGGSR